MNDDMAQDATGGGYAAFLARKTHVGAEHGFTPTFMPEMLFDFQRALVEWAQRKGRAAVFADCGLGKTLIQLVWAENVRRKADKPVLILTPLAVAFQTEAEGRKIGLDVAHRRDGLHPGDGLIVTNYERLHHFRADDYAGVVCDESSILKNFDGATRQAVTEFMRKTPYRLLCTATAAPNDYIELGTSSEALGEMGMADMLSKFFKRDQDFCRISNAGGQGWRFRGHAERDFWRWVCSWARAARRPSDLGFEDGRFVLPALETREHCVTARRPAAGMLFDRPAISLAEQREELRRTIDVRCEMATTLANAHNHPVVAWCHLNDEGRELARMIRGAVEVSGSDSDDSKEEAFRGFATGQIRCIVSKPTIAGFGLNWQHCAHQTFFPSHSYEQYYQAVRRCWRFGLTRPVRVDVISTEGQAGVLANLKRKAAAADEMFNRLVSLMGNEMRCAVVNEFTHDTRRPSWL